MSIPAALDRIRRTPWMRHSLTTLTVLTAPIWALPAMVCLLLAFVWLIADDALWRKRG